MHTHKNIYILRTFKYGSCQKSDLHSGRDFLYERKQYMIEVWLKEKKTLTINFSAVKSRRTYQKKKISPTRTCLDGAHGLSVNLKLQYMILRDWETEVIVM